MQYIISKQTELNTCQWQHIHLNRTTHTIYGNKVFLSQMQARCILRLLIPSAFKMGLSWPMHLWQAWKTGIFLFSFIHAAILLAKVLIATSTALPPSFVVQEDLCATKSTCTYRPWGWIWKVYLALHKVGINSALALWSHRVWHCPVTVQAQELRQKHSTM